MVQYTCPNCFKEFKKKSNFLDHTENKKKPCKPNITNITIEHQEDTETHQENTKTHQNTPNISESDEKPFDIGKMQFDKNTCRFCYKSFANSFSLNRHLKDRCKVKKIDNEKKEQIFNNLLEKEEKINLLINNFEILQNNYKNSEENNHKLQESNKILQKQIKELEKKLKESNKLYDEKLKESNKVYDEKIKNVITKNINSNNTINNTVNNIIIPSNKLVNFGKEDLSKINYLTILKKIFNPFIGGVKLYEELLGLIHFNPDLPEYQNVYMSDRNREKYMCYEDSDWKLSESAFITIMQQISSLKELNEDKFDEILQTDKHIYKNATTKLYREINKYYGEDDFGKRNEEFIKIVDTKIKTTLYNNSDNIKNYFLKIKDEIIKNKNNNIEQKLIENEKKV